MRFSTFFRSIKETLTFPKIHILLISWGLFFVIMTTIIACVSDDQVESFENKPDRLEISDFKILDNNKDGITVGAQLIIESREKVPILDHGVYLLKDEEYFDKISMGGLEDLYFTVGIGSGLTKGQTYAVYPYIYAQNNFIYGDTLNFESNAEIDFEITEISPINGFINDTIFVKGKSLCVGTDVIKNKLFLEMNPQRLIFESDSLIKFLVQPNIQKYKNKISFESCGLLKEYENTFEIDPFIIDSLYPKEAYKNEEVVLHGNFLHSDLSEIWIDDSKVEIRNFSSNSEKIVFIVPGGLSTGNLDLTYKMLDSTITKKDFFISTSPYVDSINKRETGFLDTLSIKGNYFLQPDDEINIKIGGITHTTFTAEKSEIKVVLDRYFGVDNPQIELKIGDFEYTETITMLPPEILFIEDKNFHIKESNLMFRTKYFLPTSENLKIGGLKVGYPSPGVPEIAMDGTIVVHPELWLIRYNEKFEFDENGEIPISIGTHYGVDEQSYKVLPPSINSVNPSQIYDGEKLEFNGLDFGHSGVSEVYLDNEILNINSISNDKFFFYPNELSVGQHQIRIKTGLQESNSVSFEILPIENIPFGSYTGTRNDTFSVYGSNMNRGSFTITANGTVIHSRQGSGGPPGFENRAEIQFPYDRILTNPEQKIAFHYAGETKELGTFFAIEPFSKVEGYEMPSFFSYKVLDNSYFEYNNKLYLVNSQGIFQFDLVRRKWTQYENEMPIWTLGIGRKPPSIDGNKLYLPNNQGFHVYDMLTKSWERMDIDLGEDLSIQRDWAVVKDGYAYLITNDRQMIIYDLTTKDIQNIAVPYDFYGPGSKLIMTKGNLYFDRVYGNIFKYNYGSAQWEDLGIPPNRYGYDANLYEYNNILYFSGGGEGQGNNILSAYDLTQNRWVEKVKLPLSVYNHAVLGSGDSLYFCLGGIQRGATNIALFKYDIEIDPYK